MGEWDSSRSLESVRRFAGGTGSISCRSITDGDAEEAAARRGPLGFAVRPPGTGDSRSVEAGGLTAHVEWGEALWTARDLVDPSRQREAAR